MAEPLSTSTSKEDLTVGFMWENSVESARAEAGGFAVIGITGIVRVFTSGDVWGYGLVVVAAVRVVMATRTWLTLAKVRAASATLGVGRFPTSDHGYDPAAVDDFWARIDDVSIEDLDEADFPISKPGYDPAPVKAALQFRIAERRSA